MTGCFVAWKCLVACLFLDESQQPTCPQFRHSRRCTQVSPSSRHSLQPVSEAFTGFRLSKCGHSINHLATIGFRSALLRLCDLGKGDRRSVTEEELIGLRKPAGLLMVFRKNAALVVANMQQGGGVGFELDLLSVDDGVEVQDARRARALNTGVGDVHHQRIQQRIGTMGFGVALLLRRRESEPKCQTKSYCKPTLHFKPHLLSAFRHAICAASSSRMPCSATSSISSNCARV